MAKGATTVYHTMPQANLTLTIPQEVWIGRISQDFPEATFRILAALPGEDAGVGLAEITASNPEAVLEDIEAEETVTALDVLQQHEDKALIQFETTMPLLLLPVQGSNVPLEMPFTIRDRQAEWTVTAPQRHLSELGTQLDFFGISFTVNEIHQQIEPNKLLTDRQLRLVEKGVEHGYYDTPRGCSLTELAAELDIAKSTCSETLHRAEEQIIKQFIDTVSDGRQEQPPGSNP